MAERVVVIEGVTRLVIDGKHIQNKDTVQGRIDALTNQIAQVDDVLAKTGETMLAETTKQLDDQIAQQTALRASLKAESLKILSDQRMTARKAQFTVVKTALEAIIDQLDDVALEK